MNHQTHRVIFNKSRGCHMVVGENARSSGGHGCSGVRRSRRNKRQSGQGSTYSVVGAALNAGFSALASSAAVSFVNNGGDLGKTLKDLGSKDSVKNILISMATAGALNELGNAKLIGDKALNQITVADGFGANLGSVLADQDLSLSAGRNVNIEAAQNTQSQSSFSQTQKSGLMGTGGLGFTIGKQQQSQDQQGQSTTAQASTIGAIGGNITIKAGQTYTQTGSDVMTPKGDIAITAKKVDITEARETGSQSAEQQFKQSGLTVAVTSPVINAVQTASSQLQAAGNTSSGRMQALAGANAAMNLKQAADALKAGQGDANGMVKTGAQNPDGSPKTNPDGTPETAQSNAADKAGGIGISVSAGSSSGQSKQSASANTARGSNINAGGNITIKATRTAGAFNDAGQDSDLTVRGSSITAGGKTLLKADDQVNIVAAQNTTQESNSSQSKSGSIGVGMQLGAGGANAGVTVSASKATGQGGGNSTSYTNSHIFAQQITIDSGGDTTIQGGVVKADQVMAKVGGDLKIESLQDTNQYKENSKSAGGSLTVGAGASGSVNVGASKINSTYTSVNEQSAIRAGDGGFQVSVKGNTTLTGAQITSTQAAIDNNENSFETGGTLTTTDLQNTASYEAKSASVGVGTSGGKVAPSGAGIGSDKDSAQSTTTAGISGVAGNKEARTGDKETGLTAIFNKDQVKAEVVAQVAITNEFDKQASKAVGDYAGSQLKDLKKQVDTETDPTKKAALQAEAAKWEEGGTNRVALHAVVGGLTGGVQGAVGAGAASAAAPTIDQLQGQLQSKLETAGLSPESAKALSSVVGSGAAAVGAAASGGSTAGAATAFNADMNNRQLHPTEVQKAKDLAVKSGGKYTQVQIEEQMRLMGNAATVEQPNTTTVLTNTDAIVNNLKNDPSMPKTAQGSVVMEVPGKANSELQNWIISNTKEGVGYIPGQSPYINSNAALNGPKLTTDVNVNAPTAKWANGDFNSAAGMPADKTGAAKVPDGSYGVGMYTPAGGGEVEVEIKNGEAVGAKVGIGAGVGGHINLGTKKVDAAQLVGPVGGGKSDPIVETNPQNPATVRVGPSITVGAGLGTVGAEASLAAGVEVNGTTNQTFKNGSVGNLTVSPVLPKIQGEIKVNVFEISVKAPAEQTK